MSIVVGYLLATVPQLIIDPRIPSHYRYGARTYDVAWPIAPAALILLLLTLLLANWKPTKRSALALITPLSVALGGSIFLYKPELPHGNLMFVGLLWVTISLITIWLHNAELIDPSKHEPRTLLQAQIDFAKEQSLLWRTAALGLLGAYLALIIGFVAEVHRFNTTVAKEPADVFLLNQYSNIQVFLISLYVLVGPILESAGKVLSAHQMLLNIPDTSERGRGAA